MRKKLLYGAYFRGHLCCTGTKQEMENKVENEKRAFPNMLGWGVSRIHGATLRSKRLIERRLTSKKDGF